MTDPFLLQLLVKMAISAAVVVVASLLAERTGPMIGAMIATLPFASGPAYIFLAVEHDSVFIAQSALVSLVVIAPTLLLVITYTALAQRRTALLSVSAATLVWLITTLLLLQSDWSLGPAVTLDLVVLATCLWIARRHRAGYAGARVPRRWWEIPARGLAIALLVGAAVVLGRELGPTAAGIASMAPVILTSLAFILHRRLGGRASASVIANTLPGMLGFTLWILTLHLAVVPLGRHAGLSLAIFVGCAWNILFLQAWRMWNARKNRSGMAGPA